MTKTEIDYLRIIKEMYKQNKKIIEETQKMKIEFKKQMIITLIVFFLLIFLTLIK